MRNESRGLPVSLRRSSATSIAHRIRSGALPTAKLTRSPTSTAMRMVCGPVQAISISTGAGRNESNQRIRDGVPLRSTVSPRV